MLIRLLKVVYSGSVDPVTTLFGRIGFLNADNEFVTDDAVALIAMKPLHVVNAVQNAWHEMENPEVEVNGVRYPISFEDFRTARA